MKTQMRFQKYLMLVTLVIAALSFVYALIFCSGTVYQYNFCYSKAADREYVAGARDFYWTVQSYNDILIILGIIFIVVAVLNFIVASNKRRKYYITNYVATGISAVYAIVLAVLLIVFVTDSFGYFDVIDPEAAKTYYSQFRNDFAYSAWNFTLGYVLAAIVLVDAVAVVLNLVWKIKLMKGEKALLQNGLVKEVA